YLPEHLWDKIKACYHACRAHMDQVAPEEYGPQKIDPLLLRFDAIQGQAQDLLRGYLEADMGLRKDDPVLKFCNIISEFSEASIQTGEEFIFTRTPEPEGAKLKVTCCDASKKLAERHADFANIVAFSATLKPFNFHLQTLGFDAEATYTAEFQSPF